MSKSASIRKEKRKTKKRKVIFLRKNGQG